MRIREHRRQGIRVLSLTGHLSGGEQNYDLVRKVCESAARGEQEVVLNLSGVKFISSTGLGILVRARSEFLVSGGMIRLCELRNRNISTLAYTHTLLLFEVHDTEAEAAAAALAALAVS